MRILFISNFYPPAHFGGMELRLQETIEGFKTKGHQCQVLTSSFVPSNTTLPAETGVTRTLNLESDVYHYQPLHYLLVRRAQLRQNREAFTRVASEFEPDLVFFWCMWNLSPAVIATAKSLFPKRVIQSFAGYWPVEPDAHEKYWLVDSEEHWLGWLKRWFAPLALSRWYRPIQWSDIIFEHAVFVSKYVQDHLRQAGLAFPHSRVILSGIETNQFKPSSAQTAVRSDLAILCAGGWAHHKGAHVLIKAVQLLDEQGVEAFSLTLIGRGHPEERAKLEMMVKDAGLQDRICLQAAVPRDEMPRVLGEHNVLVVPTLSPEPLARIVMEGMACGLTVIASRVGGIPEMIDHGHDGFLFAPGDSRQLSQILTRLAKTPGLRHQVATMARNTAVERFDIQRMIEEIEAFLVEVKAQYKKR